jgi:putative SOS response-associated peptidase YedK
MTQQTDPAEVAHAFGAELREADATALRELGPRYNVAPTQPLAVVTQRDEGRFVEAHRWGLVPPWAKSVAVGSRMINARAETVATSSAFRASFLRRRCIVPADGFYEWQRDGRQRRPFLISRPDGVPLAMAGIWAPWRDPASGDWLLTAAVVTTAANATVGRLHDRMPVLLGAEELDLWLDPELRDEALLRDLLQPAADDMLELSPVSSRLNNVANEGPELLVAEDASASAEGRSLTLFG